MFAKRKSFNPKRRLASSAVQANLEQWASAARYGGNPEHKKNPGDFELSPPASPRRHKTLCDQAGIFTRAEAIALLRSGIRRGLVSESSGAGFPQNVWAVSADGIPLEAQLENAANGTYHGYPMPDEDPFRRIVLEKWNAAHE